ncbi:expressed protein [Echinococcus multilocularis]|uniref:Expressed protein n=1 Tax=Echinococcus multilocularis TaxID=6211 RepID=A0A068Y8G7_ECHMU|nr:expressed protein [Echinococcus multilocularis]
MLSEARKFSGIFKELWAPLGTSSAPSEPRIATFVVVMFSSSFAMHTEAAASPIFRRHFALDTPLEFCINGS